MQAVGLFRWVAVLVMALLVTRLGLLPQSEAFIFWKAHTTACEMEVCDGIDTNSGRNVACCFLFSKCCGYKSIEEAEAIRANLTGTTPSP